ncbi:gluconokinase [Pseudohoeflea coraliihabitans]
MTYIVMGVSGCGKTSVGKVLASRLSLPFLDGDTLHSFENIKKMRSAIPLNDADREPWLRAIGERISRSTVPMVVGCSALKRLYRDWIRAEAEKRVCFIHLKGDRSVIARRISSRSDHFMPLSLLDSQFDALEVPEKDELSLEIDIGQPFDLLVDELVQRIHTQVACRTAP